MKLILYGHRKFKRDSVPLMHFSKESGGWSSVGLEILAFGSDCSPNFQLILDCLTPNFDLKHDDLENVRKCRVNAVFF